MPHRLLPDPPPQPPGAWEYRPPDVAGSAAHIAALMSRMEVSLAQAAEAMTTAADALTEARQCAADTGTRLRRALPWVALWAFLAITNMDAETRATLRAVGSTLKTAAEKLAP